MSDLLERMREAVELLSADHPEGSLKEQTEGLLGTKVDAELLEILNGMAANVGVSVFDAYIDKGISPFAAIAACRTAVLVAGISLGKRLGTEEGEQFGRLTAQLLEEP